MQEITFPKPKLHLFVCVNERPQGHPTPSCGPRIKPEEVKQLKQWIVQQGLATQVYCTKVQCLGFCDPQYSVAVIYPQGKFFKYKQAQELKDVILRELRQ